MAFSVPDLQYDFGALEPHIDARTMEIHHDKHHAAYVAKLNAAVFGTAHESASIEDLVRDGSAVANPAIRNNGGGHTNHSMFWTIMSPSGGGEPAGALADAVDRAFGGFDDFKSQFSAAATNRFGSGWAWLSVDNGNLLVESTPNQDTPLMEGRTPILGIDVWEHAYYLRYQNRRPDYIAAFYDVIDWNAVAQRYAAAL